jgi:hypothetical protein
MGICYVYLGVGWEQGVESGEGCRVGAVVCGEWRRV